MIAIKNGRLVLPDRVQDGKILVLADDRIRGIEDEIPQGADRVIDAHGRYVLPGFLDIHSDRIEQFILPRPTARFDFELALKAVSYTHLQMLFFPSWKFCRNAWPAVGSRSKYRLCMRVDFPDPLSPTMPSTSPG